MTPALLQQFAQISDSAAATTKKLEKQSILAAYFKDLSDEDLRLAVQFAQGRPFPPTDERVLNLGWSNVRQVILPLLNLNPTDFHALVVKSGEVGEALSHSWPTEPSGSAAGPLTLQHLSQSFTDLSSTSNTESKRTLLRDLFSRCRTGREAAYLSKIIFREMRTGVQEGVLQAAVAQAFGKDLKEIQRTQLLIGNLGDVAVLAKRNALADARFNLFHPIQFMLATPVETPTEAQNAIESRSFFCEDKLDGIRAQIHKSNNRIAIYTRTMDATHDSFPDVVQQIQGIPGEFLLDGEIVPYRNGQVLPFANIQKRLGRKTLTRKILTDHPARFIAFDILYLNGELLMDHPLRHRRELLSEFSIQNSEFLIIPSIEVTTADQIAQQFDLARTRRNEGIILKDPTSPYSPGKRGRMWFKLKTHLPTFDCVVTAAEYGHGKRRNVLSDYTFAVWDGPNLVNIGKAYSGLTDAEIARLTELFLSIATAQTGRVFSIPPKIVLEIACDQIQKSTRHAGGYALRFPRIKRIRWDKNPQDADPLSRIAEIYQSLPNFAYSDESASEPPPEPGLFDHLP